MNITPARKKQSPTAQAVTLLHFLKQVAEPNFWTINAVICLQGHDYPLLLCSSLLTRLKKMQIAVESVDLETITVQALIARCEMSFLGMRTIYWLGDIGRLSAKDRKQMVSYLQVYQGPHCILFYTNQETAFVPGPQGLLVTLEKLVNQQLCLQFFELECPGNPTQRASFAAAVFARQATLPLDMVWLLIRYMGLIGTSQTTFVKEWLDLLIVPEKSLFTLSTHFFAKDAKKFCASWAAVQADYAEPFWIAFWSDQLWRAAHYTACMERKEMVEAKKISFRLPFSFIQRDWRKSTTDELINAHDFMYTMDYMFKNGGTFWIELLYGKFFDGGFTQG